MNILINASNLSANGGATQVADSILRSLSKYPQHIFTVVLSGTLNFYKEVLADSKNVVVEEYTYPQRDWKSLITCRNKTLDHFVEKYNIQCVWTIFGPTKWVPRCKHVCGAAYPHIAFPESPFFTRMSMRSRIKVRIHTLYMRFLFWRCARCFYTESPIVTERYKKYIHRKRIITVTNYYNQVYDKKQYWQYHSLPAFDGCRILCVTSLMPHKNTLFIADVANELVKNHPDFNFQFIVTVKHDSFKQYSKEISKHICCIGKVPIAECPSLFEQCDMVFHPSLLECYSATYAEAMKMKKPLLASNMAFSRSLCKDAAVFFDPLSSIDAADHIYNLYFDKKKQKVLVENGEKQLLFFDNYKTRVDKLVRMCEEA